MNQTLKYITFLVLLSVTMCPPVDAQNEIANSKAIRLAVVITPKYSGLIDFLIEDFKTNTGLSVDVYSGTDVYKQARAGKADIVISHYGKPGLDRFVLDGYGTWPKLVFSNQAALIGPKDDPAKIEGLNSASVALNRIAKTEAPFIVNSTPGMGYLENILWESAGQAAGKGAWFIDTDVNRASAIRLAEKKQGYVLWGAYPFLRYKSEHDSKLEILVSADPLLQRVMAAVIVNPKKIQGVNFDGANAFRDYLLEPKTQAKIAAFRSPGCDKQLWWPAGRNN